MFDEEHKQGQYNHVHDISEGWKMWKQNSF